MASTYTIPLIQLGLGGVGRALVEQVLASRTVQTRYGCGLRYSALADRSGAWVEPGGLPDETVQEAARHKAAGHALAEHPRGEPLPDLHALADAVDGPAIVVDTTAAEADTVRPLFEAVLARGGAVVLANKKPLTASWQAWQRLTEAGRTGYEATVGAGLPVIATLRSLLETGDTVHRIEGAFSGTLGFLMSVLQDEAPFGASVREAKGRGWTEPDPRDDLSGTDVARKALILARTLGQRLEMRDISVTPLFPQEMAGISLADFLARLDELDPLLAAQRDAAHAAGQRLRYAATVQPGQALAVGPTQVLPDSPLGALRGPDNLLAFHTARYGSRPLVVQGAGAGTALTASAVLGDVLRLAGRARLER